MDCPIVGCLQFDHSFAHRPQVLLTVDAALHSEEFGGAAFDNGWGDVIFAVRYAELGESRPVALNGVEIRTVARPLESGNEFLVGSDTLVGEVFLYFVGSVGGCPILLQGEAFPSEGVEQVTPHFLKYNVAVTLSVDATGDEVWSEETVLGETAVAVDDMFGFSDFVERRYVVIFEDPEALVVSVGRVVRCERDRVCEHN